MTSDPTLLQRIRNGDQAALADFIQQRRPQLLAFVQKNLSDAMRRKVDPEDLVQEVSVESVRALPGVDIGDRDPFNWLCQIAERRIIDAHRHHFGTQKRDAAREQPLGPSGGDGEQAGLINLLVASTDLPQPGLLARSARVPLAGSNPVPTAGAAGRSADALH